MKFFLNLPWTIMGLILGLISLPLGIRTERHVVIIAVRSWWWTKIFPWLRGVRAIASGRVILLGLNVEPLDFEHEFVHVEQFDRYPLIFPFLYFFELIRCGYRGNRFEREAYQHAGNIYKPPA